MKIGKYPVKHTYKIPRLISDVFSVGLAVFICSVEYMFMTVDEFTRVHYIGAENIQKFQQVYSSIGWRHYLTLVYPAAVLVVFAVYAILVLKSHKFSSLNITKRNAQKVRDMYALCVSLCKIPALMLINEMMIITHNKIMSDEKMSWFSLQQVLDLAVIAMLIILFRKMMISITAPEQTAEDSVIKVKAVVKSEEPEITSDENNTDSNSERS